MPSKILFVAESITLAQVVRLVTLANSLPTDRYEIHFASGHFPALVFDETSFTRHTLETLSPERATKALEAGNRLYEKRTLLRYIDAERRLLERVEPDLVIGDFRLSLPTSCELEGVSCAVLINGYWSPFYARDAWPAPDHPIIRVLGEEMTEKYFPKALPSVFKHFAAPINAARKAHRLSSVGSLLDVLTHGDFTLYPDVPLLTPLVNTPSSHLFLGPVPWEPQASVPALDFPKPEQPLIYVTLGSSGKLSVLSTVIAALAALPVNAVIATADRVTPTAPPPNVRVVGFVPGGDLARRAQVVVSNGGSTTGYQALSAGTPVIGIPSNLDQFLAMQAIERTGAGIQVKARTAEEATLKQAIVRCMEEESIRRSAQAVAREFSQWDSAAIFRSWVDAKLA